VIVECFFDSSESKPTLSSLKQTRGGANDNKEVRQKSRSKTLAKRLEETSKALAEGEFVSSDRSWNRFVPGFLKKGYNAVANTGRAIRQTVAQLPIASQYFECENASNWINVLKDLIVKLNQIEFIVTNLSPLYQNELFTQYLITLRSQIGNYNDVLMRTASDASQLGQRGCISIESLNTLRQIHELINTLHDVIVKRIYNLLSGETTKYTPRVQAASNQTAKLDVTLQQNVPVSTSVPTQIPLPSAPINIVNSSPFLPPPAQNPQSISLSQYIQQQQQSQQQQPFNLQQQISPGTGLPVLRSNYSSQYITPPASGAFPISYDNSYDIGS
jgi:hypothetical protein